MKRENFRSFAFLFLIFGMLFSAVSPALAQSVVKTVSEMFLEVDGFLASKTKELASQGKRIDAQKREDLVGEKKSLAQKYAAEAATRSDLKETDFYYLGGLYVAAENDEKALDAMKKFLAQYPADVKGPAIQSARSYIAVLSVKRKQMAEAEQAYQSWLRGEPLTKSQQPTLEQILAVGFFKEKQYEQAIKYGQNAFNLLKTLEAKTFAEKRNKEQTYLNLIEVLALSHRKNNNTEAALEILAEARARSFTLPSANLYRKVMDFVKGSGFSEKKLMQKVESYVSAEPAPELKIKEWLGSEPATLESFRGKVVLLDFWATWCVPCIATFPRLREWQKKYGADGKFVILGVTKFYGKTDDRPLTALQELDFLGEFKRKHKLPYPFAILEPAEDAKYGISAIPTTVLLDRNGVVRYIGIGAGLEESENLEEMIRKLLKEEPRVASTRP